MTKINDPNTSGQQKKDQTVSTDLIPFKNMMTMAQGFANVPNPLGPVANLSIKVLDKTAALYKRKPQDVGLTQNLTCSLVGGVTQMAVMAPVVSAVGVLSGPVAPVACAATSIVLSKLTEPVGEVASDLCHGAFALFKQAKIATAESTSRSASNQLIAALRSAKAERCYAISSYNSISSQNKQSHKEAVKHLETKVAISLLATNVLEERRVKTISTIKEGLQAQRPKAVEDTGSRLKNLVADAFRPQVVKGFQASASPAIFVSSRSESMVNSVTSNVFVSPKETLVVVKSASLDSPCSGMAHNRSTGGIYDSRARHIDRLVSTATTFTPALSQPRLSITSVFQGTPGVNRHTIFAQANASSYITQDFCSRTNGTINHFQRSVGEIKHHVASMDFHKK